MRNSAENFINKNIVAEVKCVNGKFDILYLLADTAVKNPTKVIADAIYPKVSKETLENLAEELQNRGNKWYENKVQSKIKSLYAYANRPMLLDLLEVFTFQTNKPSSKLLLDAISFIKQNRYITGKYYLDSKIVPIKDVITDAWRVIVVEQLLESQVVGTEQKPTLEGNKENPKNQEQDKLANSKINRMAYEVAVLEELRRQLSCKLIWIEGAYRYRDPCEDLPQDFDERKEYYYKALGVPLDGKEFTSKLRDSLDKHLQELNANISANPKVKIISNKDKKSGRIKITPYSQKELSNLKALQRFINRQWSTISLIDILKEVDLRIGFTKQFGSVASREVIGQEQLLKRLLLCLYAIGSNTGFKANKCSK
ncbi:Tn3 family transposase [Candidatus Tisiphia endosymbiont of Metellina segmentata]|uniref:Tn3 family transposase n=1 Tax=Candidatus Tisiphia endosymbiont of Metellina segmentata TaxID=3066274 RepID=UPI00313EEF55